MGLKDKIPKTLSDGWMQRTFVLPITKQEFRNAKQGNVIKKSLIIGGSEICVLITNRQIEMDEAKELLDQGISVAPLDISDIEWHDIDRRCKNIVTMGYGGFDIAIVSHAVYNFIERERGGDYGGNDSRRNGRTMERPA